MGLDGLGDGLGWAWGWAWMSRVPTGGPLGGLAFGSNSAENYISRQRLGLPSCCPACHRQRPPPGGCPRQVGCLGCCRCLAQTAGWPNRRRPRAALHRYLAAIIGRRATRGGEGSHGLIAILAFVLQGELCFRRPVGMVVVHK